MTKESIVRIMDPLSPNYEEVGIIYNDNDTTADIIVVDEEEVILGKEKVSKLLLMELPDDDIFVKSILLKAVNL